MQLIAFSVAFQYFQLEVETQFFAMLMAGVVLANSVVIGPWDFTRAECFPTLHLTRLGAGTGRICFNVGVFHCQQRLFADLHVQLGTATLCDKKT